MCVYVLLLLVLFLNLSLINTYFLDFTSSVLRNSMFCTPYTRHRIMYLCVYVCNELYQKRKQPEIV